MIKKTIYKKGVFLKTKYEELPAEYEVPKVIAERINAYPDVRKGLEAFHDFLSLNLENPDLIFPQSTLDWINKCDKVKEDFPKN